MTDLYKTLGVEKTANKKQIHDSYKKKAKSVHPDMPGGSVEKFGALKKAHDVLMDPKRRAKYDTTGDVDEVTPDNTLSDGMQVIAMMLNAILGECAQSGNSPLEMDIVYHIKNKINNSLAEIHKQKRVLTNILETDKKIAGRFSLKKKKKGAQKESKINIFEAILNHRISSLQMNLQGTDRQVACHETALELLKDYQFRSDERTESDVKWAGITIRTW